MSLATTVYSSANSSGPVLWLIHPIGTAGSIWKPIVDRLVSKYSIVTADLPGHGQSKLSQGEFTLEGAAAELLEQIQSAKREVVVVGHSIGGMVAQILASKQPECLIGLVLVSTLSTPSEAGQAGMRDRAKMAREGGMEGLLQSTLERWFTRENLDAKLPVIPMVSDLLLQADKDIHAQAWEAIANFSSKDLLPNVKVPTLVVVGDKDVTTPPTAGQVIVDRCPGAQMKVVPNVGHALPQEAPDQLVRHLEAFLEGLKK